MLKAERERRRRRRRRGGEGKSVSEVKQVLGGDKGAAGRGELWEEGEIRGRGCEDRKS